MKYRKAIIQLVLFLLGIMILSVFLYFTSQVFHDQRFFSITSPVNKEHIIENNSSIISGKIPSGSGAVGSVIVSFKQPKNKNGSIMFTFKDKKKILYQNQYSMHDIYYENIFPFGFPPEYQQGEEKYIFTISPSQNNTSFPELKDQRHPYEVLYQYDRNQLLKNPAQLQTFLQKKFIQYSFSLFNSRNMIFYILPLVLYIVGVFMNIQYPSYAKRVFKTELLHALLQPSLILFAVFCIVLSVLFAQLPSVVLISGAAIWSFFLLHYRLPIQSTFIVSLLYLMTCPFLVLSDMSQAASNLASWSFVFILIASIQGILNVKSKKIRIPFIATVDHVLKQNYKHFIRWAS